MFFLLRLKQNVDPVILFNKKERARRMKTLFKGKLQAEAVQFAGLQKRNFHFAYFYSNFFELYSMASVSKTRKRSNF